MKDQENRVSSAMLTKCFFVATLILLTENLKRSNGFVANIPKTSNVQFSTKSTTTAVPKAFLLQISNKRTLQGIDQPNESFLKMAGFGGGGVSKDKKKKGKKNESKGGAKMKPKAQWDRYLKLNKSKDFRVAVRAINQDGSAKEGTKWTDVGVINSEENGYTEAAVWRQRVIIAEHASRLEPLQFPSKSRVEWSYFDEEGKDYKLITSSSTPESLPDGIDKMIGFKGIGDPKTGFYCIYDQGRLVEDKKEGSSLSDKGTKMHNY